MKKTYTKLPLILLTVLNYAPYAHAEAKNKTVAAKETKSVKNDTAALIESAASLLLNHPPVAPEQAAAEQVVAEINPIEVVNEFIQAGITDNFDQLFNSHFGSATTKEQENEFHSFLSQMPLSPAIQQSSSEFDPAAFENQIPAVLTLKDNGIVEVTIADSDYVKSLSFGTFATLGCSKLFRATINPKHNILFLHFENEQLPNMSCIGLINTNTLVSMMIPCSSADTIKNACLNADCTELGVMGADDAVIAYTLPADLVSFAPSLKQRAFMAYIDAQLHKLGQAMSTANSNDAIKVYSQLSLEEVYKLGLCMYTNKDILPESVFNIAYADKINALEQILTIGSNAKLLAEKLNIDIDTLVEKISSNELTQEAIAAILAPEQSVDDILAS